MKRPNEQKSRSARERIADLPAASQDTRKISADQLAEVLARVDGKRAPTAVAAAVVPSDDSDVSGARPVARGDHISSERWIARADSSGTDSVTPDSTQRITVTVESQPEQPVPSLPADPPLHGSTREHPNRSGIAATPVTAALTPASAPRPAPTRLVFLLFVLALALTALYAVVRR